MKQKKTDLDILCQKVGIISEYIDKGTKEIVVTPKESKIAILEAFGYDAKSQESIMSEIQKIDFEKYSNLVKPVYVLKKSDLPIKVEIYTQKKQEETLVFWEFIEENEDVKSGNINLKDIKVKQEVRIKDIVFQTREIEIPVNPQIGYHDLMISYGKQKQKTKIILAPEKTFMPQSSEEKEKVWGIPVQLYALQSKRNWGIGDFRDLKDFINIASKVGAGVVGLNPINILTLEEPEDASPYSSNSRIFKNPLYIAIDEVEEYKTSQELKDYIASKEFKKNLETAKDSMIVQYEKVSKIKLKALRLVYGEFKKNYYQGTDKSARAKDFESFCKEKGELLDNLAVFQMLSIYMREKFGVGGWRNWPIDFQSPENPQVKSLAKEFHDEVKFYKYLQWIADRQFAEVGMECWKNNMAIGLYEDLAVGVSYQSAETWGDQDLFLQGVSIGAPPDRFNPRGQQWALASFDPRQMQKNGYDFFRRVLQSNMRRSGALRVDHVMGLLRLYLIPDGMQGSYVSFPLDDLYGVLALESHRHQCVIVGEDLGTVPEGFREKMHSKGIMSLKLLWGERDKDTGEFNQPEEYDKLAALGVGTHDLPTLYATWQGDDIKLFTEYDLFRTQKDKEKAVVDRKKQRKQLLEALEKQDLCPKNSSSDESLLNGKATPKWLAKAVYSYLARTNCYITLVQLEDILGQTRQMNLPGTNKEYPNWRHKTKVFVEDLLDDKRFTEIADVMKEIRGKSKV